MKHIPSRPPSQSDADRYAPDRFAKAPESATLCRPTLDRLAELAETAESRYWATWRVMRRGMSPENVALFKNAERAMRQARAAFMAEEMYQKLMGPPA